MKKRVLSTISRGIVLICAAASVQSLVAQSGVGTPTPDADVALHVRAGATQDPLRLEGLNAGTTEEDVVVTDADGVLRYRPIADLTVSGEWRDSTIAGQDLIYAFQSLGNGTSAVLTDAGFLGIGMGTGSVPAFSLDVNGTAAVRTLPGGDVDRTGTPDYIVTAHPTSGQLRGVDVDDLIQQNSEWVVDGTGQYIRARRALENGNFTAVDTRGYFGVGTGTPIVPLDIRNATTTVGSLGGGVAQLGDGTNYISIDADDLQAISAFAPSALRLNAHGGDLSIGASAGTPGLLDAYGRARVRDLPAGDLDESGTDDEIVTADAAGNLRKVPLADLNSGEWRNDATDAYIFAKRADDAGNDVVVTDDGRLGIGTTTPATLLELDGAPDATAAGAGGALRISNGTSVLLLDDNEIQRYSGGAPSNLLIQADGGEVRIGQNDAASSLLRAYGRARVQDLPNGDVDGAGTEDRVVVANAAGDLREVDVDDLFDNYYDDDWTVVGNDQYSAVSGNVGIGTTGPTAKLDVNGRVRVRTLPDGVVNEVNPALDDYIVLADRTTFELRKIRPDELFQDEGEWNFENGGVNPDRIYARRAREDGGANVVIDEVGRLGLGTNTPDELLELDGGGIRIDNYGDGIGFRSEPRSGDPTQDGARIYTEQNALGSNRDALILEKTDFNNTGVDGGIIFANRAAGNTRVDNVIIDRDGELGVKTMQPRHPLHVFGTALFQTGGAAGADVAGGIIRVGDDLPTLSWATRGIQMRDQGDYAYFGLRQDAASRMDAVALWGSGNQEDFRFIHTSGGVEREVLTMAGDNRYVGVGVVDPQRMLDVGDRARIRSLYGINGDVDGAGTDDRIVVSEPDGDLATISATDLFQDFEDEDWTIAGNDIYNANSRAVGIGVTGGFGTAYKLEIEGDTRLRGATRMVFRDANTYIFSPNSRDLTIQGREQTVFNRYGTAAGAHPLVVEHDSRTVGIGVNDPANGYALEVEGLTRIRNTSELRFGGDDDNMMYAASNNDFRVSAQQLWSVRNRGDGTGVLSVRADQRRVGVGLNNPAVDFDVDGQARIRNLPAGDEDADFFVTADADGDLRQVTLSAFEGPWVREAGTPAEVYQRDLTDHVGIGTNNPLSALHIREPAGTPPTASHGTLTLEHRDDGGTSSIVFRSEQNAGNDFGYISYSDDGSGNGSTNQNSLLTIGVENEGAGNNNQDDIAIMPSGRLGIKTTSPEADFHVDGSVRITGIPLVNNTTDFAVTVDANGDLRQQPINQIRDNLGNHNMETFLSTRGFAISHDSTDAGMKLTAQNSAMFSNRLQVGSINDGWIDDPISGVTDGFHGNDAAFFAPVRNGAQSDLRLYVTDNNTDLFSIWGNPCGTGDCGNINSSAPVVRFFAGGDVDVERLAHGGGNDLMVLADASGTLKLGPDPTTLSGGGGTADNLGNHTATTNIILQNNRVTRTGAAGEGFRIDPNGNVDLPNGNAIIWGSVFGTGISGDVDANTDGNSQDLRLEARDDIYLETNSNNGDILFKSDDDVAFAADGGYRFSAGTANDEDFRFFVNSGGNNPENTNAGTNGTEALRIQNDADIRIPNLAGSGTRIVTADDDGVLGFMTGSSTGLWTRDGANDETYLENGTDEVGIGTADPVAALHIEQQDNAAPVELRINNDVNNGDAAIFLTENGSETAGMRLVYNGDDNRLELQQGDGNHYVSFEHGNGNVGVGIENPQTMMHIFRSPGTNAAGGANAGAGYTNPARLRIQNGVDQGASAVEFVENTGTFTDGRGMSLRYVGSLNELQVMRGPSDVDNDAYVNMRIARNSGEVTFRNLATGGANQMVVADANGLLSTQAFDDEIWEVDDTDSEVFLGAATSGYRVGIGTNTPLSTLHVDGDFRVGSFGTGAATDFVVTTDATGVLRQRPASDFENYWDRDATGNGTNAYLYTATTDDYLGVGTTAPQAKLDLDGDLIIRDLPAGVAGTDVLLVADATGAIRQIPANSYDDHWNRVDVGAQDYVELTTATDFVGIGTAGVPAAQLHTTGTVRFEDLANVAGGEMVMADASGNLYTQAVAEELWSRTGTVTSLVNSADQVGIGTTAPAAGVQLDVAGRLRIGTIDTEVAGDRVVTIGADGVLRRAPVGAYDSPWRYNGTGDVQLKDLTDDVGVGTDLPEARLHVYENSTTETAELLVHNNAGNGSAEIRLRERANNPESNSMLLRYNGQRNRFEITNGWASASGSLRTDSLGTHFVVNRNNGRVGINLGDAAPTDQLHVIGNGRFDGNIELDDGHRIQFAEGNSFLRDQGTSGGADGDVMLRAADQLYLRAGSNQGIVINNDGTLVFNDVPTDNGANEVVVMNGNNVRRTNVNNLDDQTLSWNNGTGVLSIDNGNSVDLSNSAAIDDQDLTLTGNTLALTNDATTVDLSGYLDDTDDQGIVLTGTVLTIEDGTGSIDLAGFGDDLGDHVADQNLRLNDNWLTNDGDSEGIRISGQGVVTMRPQAGNAGLRIQGAGATTAFGNGGLQVGVGNVVSIDTSAIQSLSTTTGPQALDVQPFGGDVVIGGRLTNPVVLDNYGTTRLRNVPAGAGTDGLLTVDAIGNVRQVTQGSIGSDDQQLTLTGNSLALEDGGGAIDLAGYLDNTDAQAIAYDDATGLLSITGNASTVDLGLEPTIDDQDLTLSGNTLALTNDATTVDLSGYLDDTDDQGLVLTGSVLTIEDGTGSIDLATFGSDDQQLTLAGNALTLEDGGAAIDLSGYLDNTDAQTLAVDGDSLRIAGGNAVGIDLLGDNLGDHTATQTLNMAGQWINGDADAAEGINLDAEGDLGIGTVAGAYALEALNAANRDAFLFRNSNNHSGERDVFTILDDDPTSGGGQDHSSVLKVRRTGTIDPGALGLGLVELTADVLPANANQHYYISGRSADEGAPLWGVDLQSSDYWTTGGLQVGNSSAANGTYSGGASFVNADGSAVFNDGGAAVDFRIEGDTRQNLLFVDGSADAVGIGTAAIDPGALLEVAGETRTTAFQMTGGAAAGYVLQSDADGDATWVDPSTLAGAVDTDDQTLAIDGDSLRIADGNAVEINLLGDDLGDHTATENLVLDGNYLSGDGDNEGVFVDGDGAVGIGTASPASGASLHANGGPIVVGNPANLVGTIATSERMRYVGNNSDFLFGLEDGSARVSWRWNSTMGTSPTFLSTGDYAMRIRMHSDNSNPNTPIWDLAQSDALGVAGNPITFQSRLTVTQAGNVGVGIAVPLSPLQVAGTADIASGGLARIGQGGNYTQHAPNEIQAYRSSAAGDLHFNPLGGLVEVGPAAATSAAANRLRVGGGIQAYTLEDASADGLERSTLQTNDGFVVVDGNGVMHRYDKGAFESEYSVTASDERLKRDVTPFEDVLDQLDLLNTVTYRYRDDVADYTGTLDSAIHYGIIAQDVAEAFPHAVTERADGYLAVKPNELVGVLLAAVKDLKLRNDNLEEQVYHMMNDKAALEREVDGLHAKTSELQASMSSVLEYIETQRDTRVGRN